RAYLNPNDKRVIDYRQARIICREYGVNESYLIDGIGSPFGIEIPKPRRAKDGQNFFIPKGNILYTSVEAFAGSGESIGAYASEDHYFFSVPNLSGSDLVAFPIEGRSMEPVINSGDTVICREVSDLSEIKDNQIYAVKTNGTLWVKYVKKLLNNNGKVTGLKLISANNLEFDTFDIGVNENTRLYKVVRRISNIS
ncbi:MAG TPA: S24 family peptidase, partial [Phaeodactylibacter sp.]|nr:S24 family peptidase [Phaeodactylibacter sp.]